MIRLLLAAIVASAVLVGCGSSEPPAAPVGSTTEKAAPAKPGAAKMKGLSPDSLTVPPGATSNVGSKVGGAGG